MKKRKGPGQPKKTPTVTRSVRTTRKGWRWLKKSAKNKGHSSVGRWAASEGDKRRGDAETGSGGEAS